jgi:hypothetical protein
MPRHYLFGPVTADFANEHLAAERVAGHCLAFNAEGTADLIIRPGDSWEAVRHCCKHHSFLACVAVC